MNLKTIDTYSINMKHTPKQISQHIIRWTGTCQTSSHFDGIQMAINNLLLPLKDKYPVDEVDDAERDVLQAVYHRKSIIGLVERRPTDDEITDNDSAFEGVNNDEQPTDIIN